MDEIAEQNHWSECGRGASIAKLGVLGRPHRSVLSFAVRTVVLSITAVLLGLWGAVWGFLGVMFRMDPGEESAALTHDIIVGIPIGGACLCFILALPSRMFRTARRQLVAASIPATVLTVVISALLFAWQWSILEARRRNAPGPIQSQIREPHGPANGSQPVRSETNSTSATAGSRR